MEQITVVIQNADELVEKLAEHILKALRENKVFFEAEAAIKEAAPDSEPVKKIKYCANPDCIIEIPTGTAQKYCSVRCQAIMKDARNRQQPNQLITKEIIPGLPVNRKQVILPAEFHICKNSLCRQAFKPKKFEEKFCSVKCESEATTLENYKPHKVRNFGPE